MGLHHNKRKGQERGIKEEGKGNTVRLINAHLQSPLILKKKQHQRQISHWLVLKRKKKKKKTQEGKREMGHKGNGIKRYYKRIKLTRLFGWRCTPKVFVLNPIWGNTVFMGLGVCSNWGLWDAGSLRVSGSWMTWTPYIGWPASSIMPPLGASSSTPWDVAATISSSKVLPIIGGGTSS